MRVAVGSAFVLLVVSCARAATDQASQTIDCALSAITVSPPSATLRKGDTLRANATVRQCEGLPASTAVRWRSSDTTTATVDSLTGLVQAGAPGDATIIATLAVEPRSTGAMALHVDAIEDGGLPVQIVTAMLHGQSPAVVRQRPVVAEVHLPAEWPATRIGRR